MFNGIKNLFLRDSIVQEKDPLIPGKELKTNKKILSEQEKNEIAKNRWRKLSNLRKFLGIKAL